MKRLFYFALFISVLIAPAFGGEVIDGVIATINHKPIFRSDWDEALRFESFMQQKPLSQVTEADKFSALQRLIDRQLIEAQMGDPQYLAPSAEELQKEIGKLKAQLPADASWQSQMARYSLSEAVLRDHLRDELQVLNFIEVRLRPNVRVQPEEVEAYYKSQMLPELQRTGSGKVLPFAEAEPGIRELLTQQRIDQLLEVWLHNLRQQARIETAVPIPALNASAEQVRASGSD